MQFSAEVKYNIKRIDLQVCKQWHLMNSNGGFLIINLKLNVKVSHVHVHVGQVKSM